MSEPSGHDARDPVDREHLRAFLRQVSLFRDLPPEALEQLLEHFHARDVPAGAVVVEQGTRGDELFLVEAGELEVTAVLHGKPVRLGRLHPSNIFGEMALLRNTPRAATVTAATPARLWTLSRPALAEAVSRAPAIAARLREVVRRRELANAMRALQ